MAKKSFPSNGDKVVKPKLCRKGQTNFSGTSHAVRMEGMKVKPEDAKSYNSVMQEKYDLATQQLRGLVSEGDSARTQLKISEKTSAERLLLIQREVPNLSRAVLKGTFDHYRASL